LVENPETLITRIYGIHKIKTKSKSTYIIIMSNLFSNGYDVYKRYDLKGSALGRSSKNK